MVCSDRQETPEESQRVQQSKHCVFTYHNKDENNSPKNQNNTKLVDVQSASSTWKPIYYCSELNPHQVPYYSGFVAD